MASRAASGTGAPSRPRPAWPGVPVNVPIARCTRSIGVQSVPIWTIGTAHVGRWIRPIPSPGRARSWLSVQLSGPFGGAGTRIARESRRSRNFSARDRRVRSAGQALDRLAEAVPSGRNAYGHLATSSCGTASGLPTLHTTLRPSSSLTRTDLWAGAAAHLQTRRRCWAWVSPSRKPLRRVGFGSVNSSTPPSGVWCWTVRV